MLKVRTTKTKSGSIAIQVVTYETNKTHVVKHIGSAKDTAGVLVLKEKAQEYIEQNTPLIPLPLEASAVSSFIDQLEISKTKHMYIYEQFKHLYERNGFSDGNGVLQDLAIMRLIQPESKQESISLLAEYFDIIYSNSTLHRLLVHIPKQKAEIEKKAVAYANSNLSFDFSLVFYDVTTLYFETFKSDDFRKPGYSKDGKSQQPQVVIGLVVTKEGYPIAMESFEGNRYEGHTVVPTILALKAKYNLQTLTVVADAGMLSFENIKLLKEKGLSFVVGARMRNIKTDLLKYISDTLNKEEGKYIQIETEYGILICDYLKKRASKDKFDREKQIKKAQEKIKTTGSLARRPRFVTETTESTYILNEELIAQDELKDGIKGYYTNLKDIPSELIISRYKDLWHVEKSFRIAKSDLEARPMFHRKKEAIQAHLLIVFVSLCMAKSIELKTGYSIKKIKKLFWRIEDIHFTNTLSKEIFIKRMNYQHNEEILFIENCIAS